jgi:cell division GTPase FtsZ
MSESRAAAADTRHRIPYPNARPRAIKVIGLDAGGGRIVEALGERGMPHVEGIAAGAARNAGLGSAGMLQAIVEENGAIGRAIRAADMVFVVAREGDNVALAPAIGQMAHARGVLVTGILIQPEAGEHLPATTLDALRTACDMLVMASDLEYVPEMLGALGA